MGLVVRAAIANAASTVTLTPTASDNARRGKRCRLMCARSDSAGSVRRTRTKITSVSVSTRNCVSARSGAPWKTKIAPQPYPVTPTSRTAASRLRSIVALIAAARMMSPTTACRGESHSLRWGRSRAPSVSMAIGNSTSVERMTACVAGIDPRWVSAVSRTAKTSVP